jgi:hypothetical protein
VNIDPLDSFYDECRVAPVPASLTVPSIPSPWWVRVSIPVGGLSLGGLLALLLIAFPAAASQQKADEAARSLSFAQLKRQGLSHSLALIQGLGQSMPAEAPVKEGEGSGNGRMEYRSIGVLGYRTAEFGLGARSFRAAAREFERRGNHTPMPPSPFSHESSQWATGRIS